MAVATTEPTSTMGLPSPDASRSIGATPFGISEAEATRIAKEIRDGHLKGKEAKRQHDLTAEKYLIHIDGEGDSQWADIVDGSRVRVPPNIAGGLRLQFNLERPLVVNMVAYHTAQRFQVVAHAKADKASRDRAKVDTLWANQFIRRQRINQTIAEATFFGAAYGHCPVHAIWRDDLTSDVYEPIYHTTDEMGQMGAQAPRKGFVDAYCGDPWATVYNPGAKRSSVQWYTYDRVLPLGLIQQTFGHVPGVQDLKGKKDLPSASRFQRIIRKWTGIGTEGAHGSAAILGDWKGEELISVICREVAPGVLPKWPRGRLEIVAISGAAESDEESVSGRGGTPFLIHQGPLPGGRFSATRFYSGFRGDDVLGKPYISDIDDLQVYLNQLVTLEAEWLRRFARPGLLVGPGGLVDDTVTTEDDAIIEYNGDKEPKYLLPTHGSAASIYAPTIERVMDQMFRIGGWQAASRGESQSGDAAAKVVALMRADDTLFGPDNNSIRESLVELVQTGHALAAEHMDIPQEVTGITGEDLSFLSEPYLTRDMLSDEPPMFEVVSGFGATPEATAKQLVELVGMQGADGKPLLTTDDFWRLYPDHSLRPPEIGAKHLREKHALTVNAVIEEIAKGLTGQFKDQAVQLVPQAIQMLMQRFPPNLTDPPELHIETLDMIVQDDDTDPVAREIAKARQQFYMMRMQAAMAPQQSQTEDTEARPGPGKGPSQKGPQSPASDVQSLTNEAKAAGGMK